MPDPTSAITRTDVVGTARVQSHLFAALARLPSWGAVLVIYGLSRVFSTLLLSVTYLIAASQPGKLGRGFVANGPHGDFFGFSNLWDAVYYRTISQHGYPHHLPVSASGAVQPNAWAFLPGFPWLVRIITQVTGWELDVVSVLLATAFGAAAAIVLHRVLSSRVDPLGALWGTTFFCFGAFGFILQVGYAESMFFFLMFAGLLAMIQRRYVLLMWCGIAAAFTRPGALALALALGFVVAQRLWTHDVFPRAEKIKAVVAGLAIAAAGLAWPLVAAALTGRSDAYLKTELSWWGDYIGRVSFVPLTPWFLMATKYLGIFGAIVVLALIALWIWGMRKPAYRALGPDIRAYMSSYALYLFAVFLPQQSLPRLIMPLAPLLAVDRVTHDRHLRRMVLATGMLLQITCVVEMWLIGPP